ncbi:hypothetical protein RQN30_04440 [Arcanobacterium hippocoleae]
MRNSIMNGEPDLRRYNDPTEYTPNDKHRAYGLRVHIKSLTNRNGAWEAATPDGYKTILLRYKTKKLI